MPENLVTPVISATIAVVPMPHKREPLIFLAASAAVIKSPIMAVVNDHHIGATDDRRKGASKKDSKRGLGPPFQSVDFTSFRGRLFFGSLADGL